METRAEHFHYMGKQSQYYYHPGVNRTLQSCERVMCADVVTCLDITAAQLADQTWRCLFVIGICLFAVVGHYL